MVVILSGLIPSGEWLNLLVILFVDWLSLAKAKVILGQMLRQVTIFWMSVFVIVDVASTLILFWIISVLYGTALTLFPGLAGLPPVVDTSFSIEYLVQVLVAESTISALFFSVAVVDYFTTKPITYLTQVAGPSTMFTSIWVVLFFISILVLKLLAPLEYLRRFTIWWSKDIDAHPLRAIAKVAATLIVIGGVALTLVRWGWTII